MAEDLPERPPGGSPAPVPGLHWRRVFPGDERQLGVLRRWLASLLPDRPARGDVACVATELGANAVRHTASGLGGGWFAVQITWHTPVVRVAVADGGAPAGPRIIDDPAGEYGRGLLVVAGLSTRTGVCGDHRGRLVWADVPWGARAPLSPPHPPILTRRRSVTRRPTWPAVSPGCRPGLAVPPCSGGRWQAASWWPPPQRSNWPACSAVSWTRRHHGVLRPRTRPPQMPGLRGLPTGRGDREFPCHGSRAEVWWAR